MGLRVLLGDLPVGRLVCDDSRNAVVFRFDERYLTLPQRPVLGRAFEDMELSAGLEFVGEIAKPPSFFRNYLPEGALRTLIESTVELRKYREYQLLRRVGADLPGNVRLIDDQLDLEPEEDDEGEDPRRIREPIPEGALKMSVAGLQPKLSVNLDANDRVTVPVSGLGGRWFAKFPSRAFSDLPENEYFMLEWATRLGLTVPEHRLHPVSQIKNIPKLLGVDGAQALIVKRFDRDGVKRIHQEDFAQVLELPPERKYASNQSSDDVHFNTIGRIIRNICGEDDFVEYLRRLMFMVLCGNSDAHVKNWALYYPNPLRPSLAPAYDLVSTIAYPDVDAFCALELTGETSFHALTLEHFAKLANDAGSDPKKAVEDVSDFAEAARIEWALMRRAGGVPESVRTAIDVHLEALQI